MGGHADRRTVYYGAVIHNDYVGIWQVFQAVYLYCHSTVPLPLLRESRAKASARASLRAMPLYALKVRLSCLPALSFPCLLLLRLWSIPMRRRLQWYGAISGSLCSICSSLSVRSKWQTVL
uniref:Uncharacterized protein n=1 Tax=Enterococcus faecalis TaxID=1351 RepID=Q6WRZ6_ENTFL|nr:unknown [Enterococcus faecalis]